MASAEAHPLSFEPMQATDGDYWIQSRIEIASILRSVMDRKALVSAGIDGNNHSFVTALLEVSLDHDFVILDRGPDARLNAAVTAARRLLCVTALDKVKIQFISNGATLVRHQGREVFRIALPQQILRLQRREDYRLQMPLINAPKCVLIRSDDPGRAAHAFSMTDLSCGGFAATCSPQLPEFPALTRFDCEITLPEAERLSLVVSLRSSFDVAIANGRMLRRCGFQFIDLNDKNEIALQRFVIQQQRLQMGRTSPFA